MEKLKQQIKTNRYAYSVFSFFGKVFTAIIRFMVPVNEDKILFISYGGTKVDDSPLFIYKEMLRDSYFDGYTFVWAITNNVDTSKLDASRTKIISSDRISYFWHLFSSKIWVTNTTVFRGLPLSASDDYIYINTWHGTPLKRIGKDTLNRDDNMALEQHKNVKKTHKNCIYIAQSHYEAKIYKRVFKDNLKSVEITGLPRNDQLFYLSNKNIDRDKLLTKIGIDTEKQIILYAPTFREYDNREFVDAKIKLIRKISEKYYILYRGHHASSDNLIFENLKLSNFKNVSNYPTLNDLLLLSDVLITDYSSICVDFAILNKPIYFFTYDLNQYMQNRGLYIDFENTFEKIHFNYRDLGMELFEKPRHDNAYKNTEIIRKIFLEELGSGTINVVKLIKNESILKGK